MKFSLILIIQISLTLTYPMSKATVIPGRGNYISFVFNYKFTNATKNFRKKHIFHKSISLFIHRNKYLEHHRKNCQERCKPTNARSPKNCI